MTVARTSQVVAEVLRTSTAVNVRTSQVVAEVIRTNNGVRIRTSQVAVEALRPNVGSAPLSQRPQIFVCT
jgi:hypothetical protein